MIRFLYLFVLLSFVFNANSQTLADSSSMKFPDSWCGDWSGTLEIFNGKGKVRELPMALELHPIEDSEHFTWRIIYGEDREKGLRDYELHIVDQEKGRYVIDEKNSIRIDSYLFDQKLTNWFMVEGTLISAEYELLPDGSLLFEIVAGSDEPVSVTGDTIIALDTISAVETYPVKAYQRAVLRRND